MEAAESLARPAILSICCVIWRRIVGSTTRSVTESGILVDDISSLQLDFEGGSIGTIHYLANGHKSFPKERVEIFCSGRVLPLDNFRVLRGFGWPSFRSKRLWRQDKGQTGCVRRFVEAIESGHGQAPILFDELLEVSRVSIQLASGEH